jgi:hypothetical protein
LLIVVRPKDDEDKRVGDLRRRAAVAYAETKDGQHWEHNCADRVHDEVNSIKHNAGGLYGGRTVGMKEAVGAANEIVTVLETLSTR